MLLVKWGDVYQSQGQLRRSDKSDISSENALRLWKILKRIVYCSLQVNFRDVD